MSCLQYTEHDDFIGVILYFTIHTLLMYLKIQTILVNTFIGNLLFVLRIEALFKLFLNPKLV